MSKHRTFDHKDYRLARVHRTKGEAQKASTSDHRAGFHTRVVEEDGGYARYVSTRNYTAEQKEMKRLMRKPWE